MKFGFSHLRVLLTALLLAAGSLLASAGSAGADEPASAGEYTSTAVHDAFIAEHFIKGCVATAQAPDNDCAADHTSCCSDAGSGCCATCGVCGTGPLLSLIDLARNHPGLPAVLALGSIDPQANRRPPKRLA